MKLVSNNLIDIRPIHKKSKQYKAIILAPQSKTAKYIFQIFDKVQKLYKYALLWLSVTYCTLEIVKLFTMHEIICLYSDKNIILYIYERL